MPPQDPRLTQLLASMSAMKLKMTQTSRSVDKRASKKILSFVTDGIGLIAERIRMVEAEVAGDAQSANPDAAYVTDMDSSDDESDVEDVGKAVTHRKRGRGADMDIDIQDPEITVNGRKTSTVAWLESLKNHNNGLSSAPKADDCPHLRPGVVPREHQYQALGYIEYNMESQFKGILIGDPPGLGKTLIAQMAIVKTLPKAKCPSIVVVPSSLISQWVSEFNKYFNDGVVDVFVLNSSTAQATELLKHDVIIMSYNFCMSQYRRLKVYLADLRSLKKAKSYGEEELPDRPNLSIFADLFRDWGFEFPYLILDEAHAIKNPRSLTYESVLHLRELSEGCIMLTGSPIDNTWLDIYALATLLEAQPLTSIRLAKEMFSAPDRKHKGKRKLPAGHFLARLHTFLMAWVIRRPAATIKLPSLTEVTVEFGLTDDERRDSDVNFDMFLESRPGANSAVRKSTVGRVSGTTRRGGKTGKKSASMQWAALFRAQQHAYHPSLVQIMEFIRNADNAARIGTGNPETIETAQEYQRWENWRADLRINEAWKSSRVVAIISEFNRQRDLEPDVKILIFSESVFFLDIMEIAFEEMNDPVDCIRFSGRIGADDRARAVEDFNVQEGPAVMLISQAAGGLGLNLTSATVVILCGPFWKATQEEQAYKRAYRLGQQRQVCVIRMLADDCRVETFRIETRNRKKQHNKRLLNHLMKRTVFENIF